MKLNLIVWLCTSLLLLTTNVVAKEAKQKKKAVNLNEAKKVVEIPEGKSINKHSLGIGLGETFLFGDFDENGEDRLSIDLLYSYSASHTFDLLTDIHYSEHNFKGDKVILPGISTSIKGKAFQFDKFSPFFLGGLGFYRPRINGSEAKWTFGTNFGLGLI